MLASDLDAVKELDRAVFSLEEQYDDVVYVSMPRSKRSVVAEEAGGLIVGYVFVHHGERVHANGERFGYVRSVAVHPDHRRRGYGKALLQAVVAQSDGAIDLFVDEDNHPAIALYESLGFRPAEMSPAPLPRLRMVLDREDRGPALR